MARSVAPGHCIGDADEQLAGGGTYLDGNRIYASVSGELRFGEGSLVEVLPNGQAGSTVVPEVGSTVIARVNRLSKERADCVIVAVGDTTLSEEYRGVIRRQDIRFFEVDKIDIVECFRIGDFVRAQVLALGDARSYIL